jgi:glycosyltransferase involved in cell wall biosynthesis
MQPSSFLAIACRSFGVLSETFIHDHARLLAPNATILVCQESDGSNKFGYPTHSNLCSASTRRGFRHRLSRALRIRWQTVSDPVRARWCVDFAFPKLSTVDLERLVTFLKQYAPVSLLAEFGPMGVQLSKACAIAKIPLFVHFHGWDANILGESFSIRRDYHRLFKAAQAIIVTTGFLKERVLSLGCPEQKLRVCPCGVDTENFRPGPAVKDERILMVSRLVPQKGPEYSLASFAVVAKHHSNAVLEIIGDGPLRNRLQEQAAAYGISNRTIFFGERDHAFVKERMKQAALFIQHPITIKGEGVESLGLSILEAMASGIPVVTTRHGAITETVEHAVSGYLVDERDTLTMAEMMKQLLSHPAQAAAVGTAGRRRVIEQYNQDFAIERLRSILGLTSETNRLPLLDRRELDLSSTTRC